MSELGPTLCSLALEDRIYKAVKGIEADTVLDYGTVDTGSRRVKMGEVAVWFGKMMENIRIAASTGLLQKTKSFPALTNGEWTDRQRLTAAATTGVKPVSRNNGFYTGQPESGAGGEEGNCGKEYKEYSGRRNRL